MAAFQYVPEMAYAIVVGKRLPVKSRVLLLRRLQLLGEKPEGLPGLLAM
jgi:hypothetical protein